MVYTLTHNGKKIAEGFFSFPLSALQFFSDKFNVRTGEFAYTAHGWAIGDYELIWK